MNGWGSRIRGADGRVRAFFGGPGLAVVAAVLVVLVGVPAGAELLDVPPMVVLLICVPAAVLAVLLARRRRSR